MANERRIALFLDFENLVTNTGITAATFDLQPSIDRLLEKGRVIFRRAYADWARFKEAKLGLHTLGVELIDVPPSTRAGKNSADMRLVIDALELCYARDYIDTFVIASGDSDFCPLTYKLRESDRTVIGIGVKQSTSPMFVRACDEFIYLKPPTERPSDDSGRQPSKRAKQVRPGSNAEATKKTSTSPKQEIPRIACQVAANLLGRATGPLNPSRIKETIVRKVPDFDERDHGFSTFAKLLEAMEKKGLLRRQLMDRQWYVFPAETGGAESDPEPSK